MRASGGIDCFLITFNIVSALRLSYLSRGIYVRLYASPNNQ